MVIAWCAHAYKAVGCAEGKDPALGALINGRFWCDPMHIAAKLGGLPFESLEGEPPITGASFTCSEHNSVFTL